MTRVKGFIGVFSRGSRGNRCPWEECAGIGWTE